MNSNMLKPPVTYIYYSLASDSKHFVELRLSYLRSAKWNVMSWSILKTGSTLYADIITDVTFNNYWSAKAMIDSFYRQYQAWGYVVDHSITNAEVPDVHRR